MKPGDRLNFWDYAKEAFNWKSELPLLGALPLNKMLLGGFAVLGLANPGFWLLGAAIEVSYLFGLASSERFQNVVDGRRLLELQSVWKEKTERAVDRLSTVSRDRYRRLLSECRRILGISETLDEDSLGHFRDLRARSLNQLLSIYLRLLGSRELIEVNLSGVQPDQLEQEARRLEERLAGLTEDSPLKRSLQGTLEILRRRLENLGRARESLKVMEAELERIEKHVELIREESVVSGKPEALSTRLDAVTSAMSETSRWMDDHSEFFNSLAGEEAATAFSELPDLTIAVEKE